jgi:hypothetical protein
MRAASHIHQVIANPIQLTQINGGGNFPGRMASSANGVPADCPYPFVLRFTHGNFDVKTSPNGPPSWKTVSPGPHTYIFEGMWIGNIAIGFNIRWGTVYTNASPANYYTSFSRVSPPSTTEWTRFRHTFQFTLPVGANPHITTNMSASGAAGAMTHIAGLTLTII